MHGVHQNLQCDFHFGSSLSNVTPTLCETQIRLYKLDVCGSVHYSTVH